MPGCLVYCWWTSSAPYTKISVDAETTFLIHEDSDPFGDWWVTYEKYERGRWVFYHRSVTSCRKSEVTDTITGRFKNVKLTQTNKTHYGVLALQIERSIATIERRAPRDFLGLAVRYIY